MKKPHDVAEKIIITMANENDVQDINDIVQSLTLFQDKRSNQVKQHLPIGHFRWEVSILNLYSFGIHRRQ